MSSQGSAGSSPHRRHRSDETSHIVMANDPAAFSHLELGGDDTPPELPPRNSGTTTGYRRTRSSGTVSAVASPSAALGPKEEDNYHVPADTLRPAGSGRSNTASTVSLQETKNRIMHNRILSHNLRGNTQATNSLPEGPAVKDVSDYSVPFNPLDDPARARGGSVPAAMGSSTSLHQPPAPPKLIQAYMRQRGHSQIVQGHSNDPATAPPDFAPPPPPPGDQLSPPFSPPLPSGSVPPNTDYEDPWDTKKNLKNLPIHRRVGDDRRFTAPASHRQLPHPHSSSQPEGSKPQRKTSKERGVHHHFNSHGHSSRRDTPGIVVDQTHHLPRTHSGGTSDYVPPDPSPAWSPSGEPDYVVPPDAQDHPIRVHAFPPPILHEGGIVNGGQHYVNQPQLPAPLSPPLPPRNSRTHGYPPLLPDSYITSTDHRPPPQWQINPSVPLEDQQ